MMVAYWPNLTRVLPLSIPDVAYGNFVPSWLVLAWTVSIGFNQEIDSLIPSTMEQWKEMAQPRDTATGPITWNRASVFVVRALRVLCEQTFFRFLESRFPYRAHLLDLASPS